MLCGLFILQQGNITVTVYSHVLISHDTFLICKKIYYLWFIKLSIIYFLIEV